MKEIFISISSFLFFAENGFCAFKSIVLVSSHVANHPNVCVNVTGKPSLSTPVFFLLIYLFCNMVYSVYYFVVICCLTYCCLKYNHEFIYTTAMNMKSTVLFEILKQKFRLYPAIHTNYSFLNCTISN